MILRRIFIEAQKETSSLEYNVNNAVQTGFIDVRVRGQLMEDTSALEYDIYKAVQNAVVNAHVVTWSVAMHMLALLPCSALLHTVTDEANVSALVLIPKSTAILGSVSFTPPSTSNNKFYYGHLLLRSNAST
eukprot:11895-Heterococcus_DN1.PRE.1